jgi:hypothetical protein
VLCIIIIIIIKSTQQGRVVAPLRDLVIISLDMPVLQLRELHQLAGDIVIRWWKFSVKLGTKVGQYKQILNISLQMKGQNMKIFKPQGQK